MVSIAGRGFLMHVQVKDNKGDTLEYPKVIQTLPFWDTANTYFFNDDYTVSCGGQFTDQTGGKVGSLIIYKLNLHLLHSLCDICDNALAACP